MAVGAIASPPLRNGGQWRLLPMPYRSPIPVGISESEEVIAPE